MGFYELGAERNDGTLQSMAEYRGKVLLVVNTASKCGFTPQYKGLEQLYESYRDRGLEILAFPCDQFGHQEPGTDDEIKNFCSLNYGVTFPLFRKVEVNGENTHPVFRFLKEQKGGLLGQAIKWNFTKFLLDREGNVVQRYAPTTAPVTLAQDIEKLL